MGWLRRFSYAVGETVAVLPTSLRVPDSFFQRRWPRVLVCLALSALSVLESPLLFTRIATEGALVIDFGLLTLYAFSIVTRTAIMVGLCAALYRVLRGR